MDQVVPVGKQGGGYAQSVVKLSAANEHPVGHHGHALLPEVGIGGEAVEQTAVGHGAVGEGKEQIDTEDFRARHIHEVPIVRAFEMCQIEVGDGFAPFGKCRAGQAARGRGGFHLLHEEQQAAESHFVPRRGEEFLYFRQRRFEACHVHHAPRLRAFDAEELVAVAIFSFLRLEKFHQHLPLLFVGKEHQSLRDVGGVVGIGHKLNGRS